MPDPEAARAAELVASWAGIGSGKREILAAIRLSSLSLDYQCEDYRIKGALVFADRLMRLSRENPPKE